MNCGCHDEPAYWVKDARRRKGGYWECRVKRAGYNRRRSTVPERRERITAQQRARYDADPIYRIEKNLHDHARRRAVTLKRRREQCGEVPE